MIDEASKAPVRIEITRPEYLGKAADKCSVDININGPPTPIIMYEGMKRLNAID